MVQTISRVYKKADNIGQKGGTPSTILLWILQRLYKIHGLERVEYNLL